MNTIGKAIYVISCTCWLNWLNLYNGFENKKLSLCNENIFSILIMFKIKLNEHQLFIKNTILLAFSSIISALVNILVISHLSDVLLVEGFGRYNFLLTYSNYFLLLTSLGTDIVALRRIAADKTKVKEIYGALVPLKLTLSISVFILMLVPMLVNEKISSYGWILVIFSSTVLASPFSAQCIFESNKRLEFPSIITILSQIVHFILVFLFVKQPDDLIIAAIIIVFKNAIVVLSHNFIYLRLFKTYRWNFDFELWKNFLKSGLVIGLIQMSVMLLHYFDVFMLNFMKGEIEVGLYSAAYRAMFMILTMIAIINNLMNTLLFESYGSHPETFKSRFEEYFKFSIIIGFGITVGSILMAIPYLNLFYDLVVYKESIRCFQILMFSFLFMMICIPLHSGMLAAHKEQLTLKIILFQLLCNITGNWLLIPKYGIMGSAFSTVLSVLVGFPLYLIFFKNILPIKVFKNILMAAFSVIPMAVYLYFSPVSTHYIIKCLIGMAIMGASVIILRIYTLKELIHLKDILLSFDKKQRV